MGAGPLCKSEQSYNCNSVALSHHNLPGEQVSGVTWGDAAHPDVAAHLPQLLPPALQQPRHRELGGRVEPG